MWQTIGHARAVEQLSADIASGSLARASLFTGPEHIGKLHLAVEFAAALNCSGAEPPCQTCEHCRRTLTRSHPDLVVIEPDGGHVRIGQIREMQHELALRPYEGRWRIAIVTDMHTATEEAENALLKTLEEPPAHAVIILTAIDAGLLQPTVVSRCRVMALQPVQRQAIAAALTDRGLVEPVQAEEIARLSAGRVGWALEAAAHATVLQKHEQGVERLLELLRHGHAARVSAAAALTKEDVPAQVLAEWQSAWRDVMLISAGCPELVTNRQQREALARLADMVSLEGAWRATTETLQAIDQLEQNVNPRLVLEATLLGWRQLGWNEPEDL